jgi:8-oxo-dGTP pyrophosphatase MutT (NUDIX family)
VELEDFLRGRLEQPLPGAAAHGELVPELPAARMRLKGAPPDARRSAVIVPLMPRPHALPDVLFTLRSESMRSHRGQISFPGGRIDDGESEEDAALRELHEETGVDGKDVIVLGRMSDIYIPPSNSVVTPFLSIVQRPNSYRISEAEVQEIFDIPLMRFLDSSIRRSMKREMFETVVDVPYWHVHPDVPLWGATAMILNELVWLTKEYLGEERP